MRRSSLVRCPGVFGQRDEEATPLPTPRVSRESSSDAVPVQPVEAVAVPEKDIRHERVLELRHGRFLAIVVIVCEEHSRRPAQCSTDGLAEEGEISHSRQLREADRGQFAQAAHDCVKERSQYLRLILSGTRARTLARGGGRRRQSKVD